MDKKRLVELYQNSSKHSHYQVLPSILRNYLKDEEITTHSRFEAERLTYLLKHLDFNNKSVLDIGGNTGFFSFELLENNAKEVIYVEGNRAHADFVEYASGFFKKPISVINDYFEIGDEKFKDLKVDITLLFNVIHHFGDDFGDPDRSLEEAKRSMLDFVNYFVDKTDILVLQMGFCWKGNRDQLLFSKGLKQEMIDFITSGTRDKFQVLSIGVPVVEKGTTVYEELNDLNMERNDSIGEFRNRPIFILKRKEQFNRNNELNFLNSLVVDYKDNSPYSKIKKEIIYNLIVSGLSKFPKYSKALQLGCSNGYETKVLSEYFEKLTVVDGSSIFINRMIGSNRNNSINYVHSLFEDIDNTIDEKYDVVVCNYILEHVYDPQVVLKAISNKLSENGLLFIVVPNANALSRRIAQEMGLIQNLQDLTRNDLEHGHRRVYTRSLIEEEVKRANLTVLESKGVVFKILADFQLNALLNNSFLEKIHIEALQKLAMVDDNIDYSDSIFLMTQKNKK